jgi:hypothetical protein
MYTINFRARRTSQSISEDQDSVYTNEFRVSRAQTTVSIISKIIQKYEKDETTMATTFDHYICTGKIYRDV